MELLHLLWAELVIFVYCRKILEGLDQHHLQLLALSSVGVGCLTCYLIFKKKVTKTIPLGEGWWGRGERSLSEDEKIHPFTVETSEDEIQVRKIKNNANIISNSNKTNITNTDMLLTFYPLCDDCLLLFLGSS